MNEHVPNPVIRSTPLRAYPGWYVREYANGVFDAMSGTGLTAGADSFAGAVALIRDLNK